MNNLSKEQAEEFENSLYFADSLINRIREDTMANEDKDFLDSEFAVGIKTNLPKTERPKKIKFDNTQSKEEELDTKDKNASPPDYVNINKKPTAKEIKLELINQINEILLSQNVNIQFSYDKSLKYELIPTAPYIEDKLSFDIWETPNENENNLKSLDREIKEIGMVKDFYDNNKKEWKIKKKIAGYFTFSEKKYEKILTDTYPDKELKFISNELNKSKYSVLVFKEHLINNGKFKDVVSQLDKM